MSLNILILRNLQVSLGMDGFYRNETWNVRTLNRHRAQSVLHNEQELPLYKKPDSWEKAFKIQRHIKYYTADGIEEIKNSEQPS